MKTLPNGLVIFNATPHPITFGCGDDFDDIVVVEPDEKVDARPLEASAGRVGRTREVDDDIVLISGTAELVRTEFVGTDEGKQVIARAVAAGADLIIGSIIAAQAYPGDVLAMIPCPGFERVPPAEKRMRPDKFTVF